MTQLPVEEVTCRIFRIFQKAERVRGTEQGDTLDTKTQPVIDDLWEKGLMFHACDFSFNARSRRYFLKYVNDYIIFQGKVLVVDSEKILLSKCCRVFIKAIDLAHEVKDISAVFKIPFTFTFTLHTDMYIDIKTTGFFILTFLFCSCVSTARV